MKQIVLILLLGFSILNGAETIDEQKKMKEVILKLNVPVLESSKKAKACLLQETEEKYLACMKEAQNLFLNSDFGKVFSNRAEKITSDVWKDKEKREKGIQEYDEIIKKLEAEVACANDPKTVDYTNCLE